MKFRLKDFRQAHGLFQSDMADLLGLTQSTVSRAELKEGGIELTYPQRMTLFEKYGEEEVSSFFIEEEKEINIINNGNVNDDGFQNNGVIKNDRLILKIVNEQSGTIASLTKKLTEQTDRMLAILEKLTDKL